jgi:hydrogenase/urease accessory protein HupE
MIWLSAGFVILGILCGLALRLVPFIVVLLAALFTVIGVELARGDNSALLDALVTVAALQVGYVLGLVLRAALHRSSVPDSNAADRPSGFLRHLSGHWR